MSSATAQLRTSVPKPVGPVLPSCDYESAPKQHQSIPIHHTSNYVWLSYERLPERTRLRRLLPQVVHPFTKQSPPWKRWGSLSYTSKGLHFNSFPFNWVISRVMMAATKNCVNVLRVISSFRKYLMPSEYQIDWTSWSTFQKTHRLRDHVTTFSIFGHKVTDVI